MIADFCQGLLSELVRIQFLGRIHFFSNLKGSKIWGDNYIDAGRWTVRTFLRLS